MPAINTLLEALWASERVLASPSFTAEEKTVILEELKQTLPSPFHAVSAKGTREIVLKRLNQTPSIITDETEIGTQEHAVPTARDSGSSSDRPKAKANAK